MRNLVEIRDDLGLLKAKATAIWQTVSKIRPRAAAVGINTMDDLNAHMAGEPEERASKPGTNALFSVFHDEYKAKYYKAPQFTDDITHITIDAVTESALQEPAENVTNTSQIPVAAVGKSGKAELIVAKRRVRRKAYREANREKILIAQRTSKSDSLGKEAKQAQARAYYAANREKLQEYGRAYYRAKRENQELASLGKLATPKPEPTATSAASVESNNLEKKIMTPEEIADFVARLYK
jgi:hypothetical protein